MASFVARITNDSRSSLSRIFDGWYKKYLHWQIGIYYYFCLEPVLTDEFFSALEFYLRKKDELDKLDEYSSIIMAPEKMNAVTREQLDLYKAVLDIKKNPSEKSKIIEKHHKKYLWIPCYDIHHKEYSKSYFEKKIEELLKKNNIYEEIQKINNDFKKRKNEFEKLVKNIDDTKLKNLSGIMHWLVFYKDHRDDLRREAGYAGKRYMRFLAEKLALSLEEINYLTPNEIKNALKGNILDIEEIRKRIPSKGKNTQHPSLKESSMRYCEDVGQQGDYVERTFHRPRLCRCPDCGTGYPVRPAG